MANAKKCDRCRTLYDPEKTYSIAFIFTTRVGGKIRISDLCKNCEGLLLDFLTDENAIEEEEDEEDGRS